MSDTIGNACAPLCCMMSPRSTVRSLARPRMNCPNASATWPRKISSARVASVMSRALCPSHTRREARFASRRASWCSGTAVARAKRRCTPCGSPAWSNSIWDWSHSSLSLSKKVSNALSQSARSDASKLRRRTRGVSAHWACTSAADGRAAWIVHCPASRTHSVSAAGRVTSSVPWGCVTGVVASMQCAAPMLPEAGGSIHRWYTKPSWDTRKVPGSSIDRSLVFYCTLAL